MKNQASCFITRQHTYARCWYWCCSSVCTSVCLSQTGTVKMAAHIIKLFLQSGRDIILSFWIRRHYIIDFWLWPQRGVKYRRSVKTVAFLDQHRHLSRKPYKTGSQLLRITKPRHFPWPWVTFKGEISELWPDVIVVCVTAGCDLT